MIQIVTAISNQSGQYVGSRDLLYTCCIIGTSYYLQCALPRIELAQLLSKFFTLLTIGFVLLGREHLPGSAGMQFDGRSPGAG